MIALQNGVDNQTLPTMLDHTTLGSHCTCTALQKQDEAVQTVGYLMAQVQ